MLVFVGNIYQHSAEGVQTWQRPRVAEPAVYACSERRVGVAIDRVNDGGPIDVALNKLDRELGADA